MNNLHGPGKFSYVISLENKEENREKVEQLLKDHKSYFHLAQAAFEDHKSSNLGVNNLDWINLTTKDEPINEFLDKLVVDGLIASYCESKPMKVHFCSK